MATDELRLLVVDDCVDDFELLCHHLHRTWNHLVARRIDCDAELRSALKEGEWDVVVSDHCMPRFTSLEALRLVRESGIDIPFILYSGGISERMAYDAMRDGVQDFVAKGDLRRLVPSIQRELKSAATRAAARRAESHVYRLAYYDELTGLPNRNLFCERLNAYIGANPAPGAVMFIDIDHFMRLNNTFGYATGDVLMRQAAQRLKACVGESILVARLRSDEYALFVGAISDRAAIDSIAQRIALTFAEPFTRDSLEFEVTLSIGICRYPDDGTDAATLLINAENAGSQAKRKVGTSHTYYDNAMGVDASRRLRLEATLRRAVEHAELFLEYQPIADMRTGNVVGTEALVRWRHPDFGILAPDRFIPIADETGLIIQLGEWVLREACSRTRQWNESGYSKLGISVNVSAVQFAQPQLLGQVRLALEHSGLAPEMLELEITESVLMRDAQATVSTLSALKEMGVRIAVDDFGTGYSSLSYLQRFPIDALKIDRSFTKEISNRRDNPAIVCAIIALGRSLNLRVVAEGVETAEQRACLSEQGCDFMQGYLLSRPLPAERVPAFLTVLRFPPGSGSEDSNTLPL